MKKIINLCKTSPACPEQYEGFLDTGERVFLRVRSGIAELRTGNEEQWENWTLDVKARVIDSNKLLGEFGPGVLAELFRKADIRCDINIDKLQMPEPRGASLLEQMMEDARKWQTDPGKPLILTYDKDIIHGKEIMDTSKTIELDEEKMLILKKAVEKNFPNAR